MKSPDSSSEFRQCQHWRSLCGGGNYNLTRSRCQIALTTGRVSVCQTLYKPLKSRLFDRFPWKSLRICHRILQSCLWVSGGKDKSLKCSWERKRNSDDYSNTHQNIFSFAQFLLFLSIFVFNKFMLLLLLISRKFTLPTLSY